MDEALGASDRLLAVFTDAYAKALYSSSERWSAYWDDPTGRKGFLVPVEVEQVTNWPPSTRALKRLSLVGLSETEAENALLAFLQPPKPPDTRPPFPGRVAPKAKDSLVTHAPTVPDGLGERIPTRRPAWPTASRDVGRIEKTVFIKAIESAAKANERTAAAEIRLEEMRQKIGPRRIDEEIFLSRLVGVPKKPVVVSHAPDDPDSYFLASGLLSVLGRANWDAQYVGTTPENVKMCGANLGGVLVLIRHISDEEVGALQRPPKDRPKTPWLSLTDALVDSLAGHAVGLATCPFVPDDTLHVVISSRWVFFPK